MSLRVDGLRRLDLGGKILVSEGAMGTMLASLGASFGEDVTAANLESPGLVERVHAMYAAAGATVSTTNSFSVCTSEDRDTLDRAARACAASVMIARSGNPDSPVLGDVGPCSLVLEPLGDASFSIAYDAYRRHIEALMSVADPPDAILLETFIDIADLRCALFAARSVCDLPIIVSCTFDVGGTMPLSSTPPAVVGMVAEALGASAVGMNCGLGPAEALGLVEEMSGATTLPLLVQPNAGLPVLEADGSTSYPGTPEPMASFARRFIDMGVQIVGSCCGSTPEFTKAISEAVSDSGPVGSCRTAPERGSVMASAASMSVACCPDVLAGFDLESAEVVEIPESDLDPWDLLELASFVPVALVPERGSSWEGHLDSLAEALKIYPGRAVVVCGSDDGSAVEEARGVTAAYGAIMVDSKGMPLF